MENSKVVISLEELKKLLHEEWKAGACAAGSLSWDLNHELLMKSLEVAGATVGDQGHVEALAEELRVAQGCAR